MIPKKIHYCWFGGKPLPDLALKCIESWKKFLPEYEIVEWNEKNFDVHEIPYISQAYDAGKFAFVSDYARFKILYENGGLYFDTDVEVISNLDDIISKGPFMGFEINASEPNSGINPGLGLGAEVGLSLYKEIIDDYKKRNFINSDGSLNLTTVVKYTTDIFLFHGLKRIDGIQIVEGINLYPKDYFNPLDDITGRIVKTSNTRSIHWYAKTWLNRSKQTQRLLQYYHRLVGPKVTCFVRKILNRK